MINKLKTKKLIRLILILIIVIVTLLIIYKLVLNKSNNNSNYKNYAIESRIDETTNQVLYDTLVRGWVRVQGTNIDFPIVMYSELLPKTPENFAWLNKFVKEEDNRIPIFGHNVQNVSSKPLINNSNQLRFEQLMSFVYFEFAENNLYIQITSNGKDELYKIYGVSFVTDEEEDGRHITDKGELFKYIKKVKSSSLYDYDIDVNDSDSLISLITCTRYFGLSGPTQFKVDARKVRNGEKIAKYSVQKNNNYDILIKE